MGLCAKQVWAVVGVGLYRPNRAPLRATLSWRFWGIVVVL